MNKLSSYKSKAPEFQRLGEGSYGVRLVSYKETDSFHNYDGTLKDELPEYSNPCEQLAITVVSLEGKGGITHRLNMEGYVKFSELTDTEVKSGKFTDINGFACGTDKKSGKLVRIADEAKSRTCENILDQFFSAVQLKEGSGINDLDRAIADKYPFEVTVINEPYEDKDQLRISRFRKATVATVRKVDIEA